MGRGFRPEETRWERGGGGANWSLPWREACVSKVKIDFWFKVSEMRDRISLGNNIQYAAYSIWFKI